MVENTWLGNKKLILEKDSFIEFRRAKKLKIVQRRCQTKHVNFVQFCMSATFSLWDSFGF